MTNPYPPPGTLLPHAYPFLMIDKIVELEENKRVVCLKNVSGNEEFFIGHFKGNPVMPGVLIIESMAQASGLIIGSGKPAVMYLSRVNDARFKKAVMPGDQLIIKSSLVHKFHPLYVFEAAVYVNDMVVSEAEITLAIG